MENSNKNMPQIIADSSVVTMNSTSNEISSRKRAKTIHLELKLGDITHLDKKQIESQIKGFISNIPTPADTSELRHVITIQGSVETDEISYNISIKLKGFCSKIKKEGIQLASKALYIVKIDIKNGE